MRELRITTDVEDADGASHLLDMGAFPTGLCTVECENASDCGSCAECVPYVLAGRARLRGPLRGRGVCRPRCDDDGACPYEYACDLASGACLERCRDDADCAFVTVDTDGDGVEDMLRYAPEDRFACDRGRCRAGVGEGTACFAHEDCEGEMWCARDPTWDAERPGRCAKDCDLCLDDESCLSVSEWGTHWCAARCVVGADAPDAILGRDGHGDGCWAGFRCESERGTTVEGSCAPGAYNDVTAPNVGALCETDDECFSPYGRGRCMRLTEASQGQCTLVQCIPEEDGRIGLLPDIELDPVTWCDPSLGLACRAISAWGRERTACVRPCGSASECREGWACPQLADRTLRACTSECFVDYDCRSGERCLDAAGARCAVHDSGCTCRAED